MHAARSIITHTLLHPLRISHATVIPCCCAPLPTMMRRSARHLASAASVAPVAIAAPAASSKARSKRKAVTDATAESVTVSAATIAAESAAAAPAEPAAKRSKAAAAAAAVAPTPPKRKAAASSRKGKGAKTAVTAATGTDGFKHGTLGRDFEHSYLTARGVDPFDPRTVLLGVDEAGRGPLAGPVVCAAAFVPADVFVAGVHDSKLMSAEERERAFTDLTTHPRVRFEVAVLEHDEIDRINILEATMQGMRRAANGLSQQLAMERAGSALPLADSSASASAVAAAAAAALPSPVSLMLIDGNRLPKDLVAPAEFVIKGDSQAYCIAAASIIAKVTRDRLMDAHHARWPQYNFAQHKGYGVSAHMSAIYKHGPCPIHRMTFAPMKHMKSKGDSDSTGKQQQSTRTDVVTEEVESATPAAAAASASSSSGRRQRSTRK